jgi:predicted dithiol-disulfide oxidoreductase (DUF899 family)
MDPIANLGQSEPCKRPNNVSFVFKMCRNHFKMALSCISSINDVSLVTVSRAPFPEIAAFKKRMGWRFKWVSSYGNDFNYAYQVSFTKDEITKGEVYYNYGKRPFQSEEMSGISVFFKDETGNVFHTYSCYARGDELLDGAYNYLDLTPKGRNETGPNHNLMDWVRRHDEYEDVRTLFTK